MNELPVIAVVPNYNMAEQLTDLLPVLTNSGYDDIFVIDDASGDHSREAVRAVNSEIHFIENRENRGPGANRNRILKALTHPAVIHFIDADTSLDTERAAEVIAAALPSEPFGFIGGLAKTTEGFQTVWNYGPRQSLWGDLGAKIQYRIAPLLSTDPSKAIRLRGRFSSLLEDWPDPLSNQVRRRVFWAVEQSLVVNSETFASVGGFDENLLEHEIQDLAVRMARFGLMRYFDPSFAITHKKIDVRGYNRTKSSNRAEVQIALKHGIRNWLLPDGKLRPAL